MKTSVCLQISNFIVFWNRYKRTYREQPRMSNVYAGGLKPWNILTIQKIT